MQSAYHEKRITERICHVRWDASLSTTSAHCNKKFDRFLGTVIYSKITKYSFWIESQYLKRCRGLYRVLIVLNSIQGNTSRESYEKETRMLVGKLELNPKASWQSGCGLYLIGLRYFFTHNHRTIPLWLVWLKILNTQNLHFLPLRRRRTFSKGSPPTLLQPRSDQASQQGGAKGSELELHIPF